MPSRRAAGGPHEASLACYPLEKKSLGIGIGIGSERADADGSDSKADADGFVPLTSASLKSAVAELGSLLSIPGADPYVIHSQASKHVGFLPLRLPASATSIQSQRYRIYFRDISQVSE